MLIQGKKQYNHQITVTRGARATSKPFRYAIWQSYLKASFMLRGRTRSSVPEALLFDCMSIA